MAKIKKPDNSIIDSTGIRVIGNFLALGGKCRSYLYEHDKVPVWDGHIYVYKNADTAENIDLFGTIRVQVKSSLVEKLPEKESFQFSRTELELYQKDGGVLIIRPVFTDIPGNCYKIFTKVLFPMQINKILTELSANRPSISLDLCVSIEDFEALAIGFINNKPKQLLASEFNMDNPNEILITATVPKRMNPFEAFFSNFSYTYIITKDGISIPTDLDLVKIESKRNLDVTINGRIHFHNIKYVYTKEHSSFSEFNSAMRIVFDKNQINFHLSDKPSVILEEFLQAISFIKDLQDGTSFSIGGYKFQYSENIFPEIEVSSFNDWFEIVEFLKNVKVDLNTFTLGDMQKFQSEIVYFMNNLKEDTYFDLPELNVEQTIRFASIKERKIPIYICRKTENLYSGKNFMSLTDLPIRITTDKGDLSEVSRFIILPEIMKNKFLDFSEALLGYHDIILQDISDIYKPKAFVYYNNFVLACLLSFDKYENKEFFSLAEKTLQILNRSRGVLLEESQDILLINIMQTKARIEELTPEDIDELIDIQKRRSKEAFFECSVFILTESFKLFEQKFKQLEKSDQEYFQSWPIWNLYKKKVKLT